MTCLFKTQQLYKHDNIRNLNILKVKKKETQPVSNTDSAGWNFLLQSETKEANVKAPKRKAILFKRSVKSAEDDNQLNIKPTGYSKLFPPYY